MEENFSDLGKIAAIEKLYAECGAPYKPFTTVNFPLSGKVNVLTASKLLLEGIDFSLTYFPLRHLGYKSVVATTAELYADMARPAALNIRMGVGARNDYAEIKEVFAGCVVAAREHGYSQLNFDIQPSKTGLSISVNAVGWLNTLTQKRRSIAQSKDIICVGSNIGAAFFGQHILNEHAKAFESQAGGVPQPDLTQYKMFVGAYLKPEVPSTVVQTLEKSGIYPSYGYVVSQGLGDAVRRLVRDSGFGAKIYVNQIPFEGQTFDLGRKFNIDPVSAAFNGGDDYALLYVVPLSDFEKFNREFPQFEPIGHLAQSEVGAVMVAPDGLELPIKAQGW